MIHASFLDTPSPLGSHVPLFTSVGSCDKRCVTNGHSDWLKTRRSENILSIVFLTSESYITIQNILRSSLTQHDPLGSKFEKSDLSIQMVES